MLTSHDGHKRKKSLIDFVVIRHLEKHNIILGKTTLFRLGVVLSTIHVILKFCITEGLMTFLSKPPKTFQFHQIMQPSDITRGTKRPRSKMPSEKEVINARYPDQPIRIETNIPPASRETLLEILNKYKNIFAWKTINMVGVDMKVIEHIMNIKIGIKKSNKSVTPIIQD